MTPTQLLMPRYIVTARDTSGNWSKDQIIQFEQDFKGRPVFNLWYGIRQGLAPEYFDQFPHLFRLLHWSEYREVGDMPEYIKRESGKVFEIQKFVYNSKRPFVYMKNRDENGILSYIYLDTTLPATHEEYIQYQQTKVK